jgi:hypothetical protein
LNPEDSDTDNDGIDDGYEVKYGLDPTSNDAILDLDSDGLNNLQEYKAQTDPHNPDTDSDGFNDNIDKFPLYDLKVFLTIKKFLVTDINNPKLKIIIEGMTHTIYGRQENPYNVEFNVADDTDNWEITFEASRTALDIDIHNGQGTTVICLYNAETDITIIDYGGADYDTNPSHGYIEVEIKS